MNYPTIALPGSGDGPELYAIGAWTFDPALGELSRGEEKRRIEFRAARTLALLCRRSGAVVTAREILDEVWDGRSVSPNSVAVVISDIRRAIDDDARRPTHLETIAKRGYRLALAGEGALPAMAAPVPRRWWPVALAVAAVVILLAGGAYAYWPAPRPRLAVEAVRNETGSAQYDPAAHALTELFAARLSRSKAVTVIDASGARDSAASDLVLGARLILWDGHPTLSMKLTRRGSGEVQWSGMAMGPPFHGPVTRKLDELLTKAAPH